MRTFNVIPEELRANERGGPMTTRTMNKLDVPLAMFAWICSTAPVLAQGAAFAPASPVKVGPGSGRVVLVDVDRDGHLDLLTQHLLQRNVAVQLGDGKGHFVQLQAGPMNLDFEPSTVAVDDVNNDAIPDLGVTSRDSTGEYVHIFMGNGRGGFSPAAGSPFAVTESVERYKPILRLANVNDDGRLDIVTANGRRDTLEILFGDGRGAFSRGPVLKQPGQGQYSFAVGDVHGDGLLDIVTASTGGPTLEPGSVVTRRGDGKGAFEEAPSLSVPTGARIGTLADVNGDQHLDILLSHADRNHLSILLNDGHGLFKTAAGSPLDVGMEAFAVVVADVNRDKKADLVAALVNSRAAPFDSKIAVLLGDGVRFVPAPGSPFHAGRGAYNLAVGDVNEDGRVDVAASSFEGDAVTLLLGQ